MAEQVSRLLGVIQRRVGLFLAERYSGCMTGPREHRLAQGDTGQGCRIETAERVERIALDLRARGGSKQELVVKERIVADQHCPIAVKVLNALADIRENRAQRLFFIHRVSEGVVGIDPRELQRGLFDIGPGKRCYMKMAGVVFLQPAMIVEIQGHGGNFEQGIGRSIESPGLHVNDDR